jgi:hypothetical protein
VETQVPLFFTDLEEQKKRMLESASNMPTPDTPIEDIFAMYRATKALFKLIEQFTPGSVLIYFQRLCSNYLL